ncbi:hypothetical protein Ae717Ps2_6623 [Pseudonocardia sp. Ae717_Ps2]|uniref:hypothetical protein n=1 Tax=Pseudonocardia sp. Ae717_Ps2 TaxID=1885573 RepID=UPI0009602EE1|nr:hypothetical protein [Pseudonocardia sp. Ae717_Ps2]OLM28284.1 hypothetical protein Ae717Ps2_6623 [Pseudonocardia sp. Ae717_Ps2]
MNWRVGVLRAGTENTTWTASGAADDWSTVRRRAIDAVHELALREGRRQEYRLEVDDIEVIAWPGLDDDRPGGLDLSGVDDVLPRDRTAAAATW